MHMLLILLACVGSEEKPPPDTGTDTDSGDSPSDTAPQDADADGWAAADDCDDDNAAINPGAVEVCNDVDDNCDGATDEGDYYPDTDGDGYGDAAAVPSACTDGRVTDASDCDATDGSVHPGAREVCWGVVDVDCDGQLPECSTGDADVRVIGIGTDIAPGIDGATLAGDTDGDGYADLLAGEADLSGHGTTDSAVYLVSGAELPAPGEYALADVALWAAADTECEDGSDTVLGLFVSYVPDIDGAGGDEVLVFGQSGSCPYDRMMLLLGETLATTHDLAGAITFESGYDSSYNPRPGVAGDFDGDGIGDFSLNNHGAESETTFFLGSGAAAWTSPVGADAADARLLDTKESLGASSLTGDLNGDGADDIVFTSGLTPGVIFSPLPRSDMTSADADIRVSASTGAFAIGGGLRDLDGDGHGELMIDWYIDEDARYCGDIYLFHGGDLADGATLSLEDAPVHVAGMEGVGLRVDVPAGDVNADGNEDVLFQVNRWPDGSGGYLAGDWLVSGPDLVDGTHAVVELGVPFSGMTVAAGGDLNADGHSDLLFGTLDSSEHIVHSVFFGREW